MQVSLPSFMQFCYEPALKLLLKIFIKENLGVEGTVATIITSSAFSQLESLRLNLNPALTPKWNYYKLTNKGIYFGLGPIRFRFRASTILRGHRRKRRNGRGKWIIK